MSKPMNKLISTIDAIKAVAVAMDQDIISQLAGLTMDHFYTAHAAHRREVEDLECNLDYQKSEASYWRGRTEQLVDAQSALEGQVRALEAELRVAKGEGCPWNAPVSVKADFLRKLTSEGKLAPWYDQKTLAGDLSKIKMIKEVRGLTDWGLKESKDAVEAIWGEPWPPLHDGPEDDGPDTGDCVPVG